MRPRPGICTFVLVPALFFICSTAIADIHLIPNKKGALAGKTVVFSPGHGIFLDGSRWRFQRARTPTGP